MSIFTIGSWLSFKDEGRNKNRYRDMEKIIIATESRVVRFWQVRVAFALFLIAFCSSCDSKSKIPGPSTLTSFQAETGVRLATNTIVIAESGGNRSEDTYEWTLFSPGTGSIVMPPAIGGGYLTNELRIAIEVLEEKAKKKIADGNTTFTSVWKKERYQYRGIVLHTTNGDYLYLQRF